MFGLEILDVVIGLMFVYLLLALFATALNEYIAAVMNLRGKELAKGLGKLLDDIDEKDALKKAFDGVGPTVNEATATLTERFYNHRLIRPLATRRGWLFDVFSKEPRLPSYIPARTFALALLDVLGVDDKDASLDRLIPTPAVPDQAVRDAQQALTNAEAAVAQAANKEQAAKAVTAARANLTKARLAQALTDAQQALARAQNAHDAAPKAARDQSAKDVAAARQALSTVQLAQVLALLKQESPIELTEHLEILSGLPQADKLASALQVQVAGLVAGAQTQLQKLHDGVEVWFNNAMDRVSGAYKRTTQGWLFVLGLLIAACMNADTIDMWRRLEADDELRAAMVRRAEAAVAPMDSLVADSAAAAGSDSADADSADADSADADSAAAARADSASRSQAPSDTTTPTSQPTDTTRTDTTVATPGDTPTPTDTPAGAGGDTIAADSAKLAAVKRARANYQAARTRLDSMELKLGWTTEQWVQARLLRKNTPGYPRQGMGRPIITGLENVFAPRGYHADLFPFDTGPTWAKLIGLLLTALAISLGAPFWFDLLNKVISIRAAGRSPEERPKSPEGGPKRIAERAPK